MTKPDQSESERINEPELLEAEGFLNRAWRRLGEGLGPFVADKTGKDCFKNTRDVYAILSEMDNSWNTHFRTIVHDERDRSPRSWVIDLLSFRNGPWAHLVGYSDYDVLKYLYQIEQLLRLVSADKQAEIVEQMHKRLGKLLFSGAEPQRQRESEIADLRHRISDLEGFIESYLRDQLEVSQSEAVSTGNGDTSDFFSGQINLGLSDEEYSQAIADLDETLRRNPGDASVYFERAKIHSEKLEYGLAVDDFSTALQLDPNNATIYIERGNLYYRPIGDTESAIADYTAALLLNPDDTHNHVLRGIAYSDMRGYDLAIADYGAALQLDSGDRAAIHMLRGGAHANKGEYDLAIADYGAAIQLAPDDVSIYIIRGNAHRYGKREYDLAIADYGAALRIQPDCMVAYVGRGETHVEKREWGQAIADFSSALECFRPGIGGFLDPGATYRQDRTMDMPGFFEWLDADLPTVYLNRGKAHLQEGDYDLAIADFSAALDCDPDEMCRLLSGQPYHWYAYYCRGVAYTEKAEYDLAIADFEEAVVTCPPWNADAAEQLRKIKDETARIREGKSEYDRHIEESPADPQGWYLRGIHFFDLGYHTQAIADFTEAIRLDPEDAELWNDRGKAYWQQGEDNLAYADYSRAIEINPDFANAYYYRAWVWRRRGDQRNAIKDFGQAINVNPGYAAAYQHRGISYFDTGERDNAQADFEKARCLGFEP